MTKPKKDEDKKETIKLLDEAIAGILDDLNVKKKNNFDLVYGLLAIPSLHEIYLRLEAGQKAIEENKRIKASLDAVANQIKSMFKLV